MVSPVSNGLPQQIPASNTFQPGGSQDNVRQKEDREETRAANASSTNETSRTAESNTEKRTSVSASSREEDNGQTSARTSRGSVLDVVV